MNILYLIHHNISYLKFYRLFNNGISNGLGSKLMKLLGYLRISRYIFLKHPDKIKLFWGKKTCNTFALKMRKSEMNYGEEKAPTSFDIFHWCLRFRQMFSFIEICAGRIESVHNAVFGLVK